MKTLTDRQRTLEMACLSQLAYIAYKQGNDIVMDILRTGCPSFFKPYQTIEFIYAPRPLSDTNELISCGLVLSTESDIVISIRGTERLDDYFFNLLAFPNSEAIHSGFNLYVNSFWQQLQDFIQREENANKNIFVTGHSLGGAAATLIAKRLSETDLKPIAPYLLETYTFGAPPVSTMELILDTPIYRFRNIGDFIPHLPKIIAVLLNKIPGIKQAIINWKPELLQTLADYSHVGSEYCINKNFQILEQNEPNIPNIKLIMQISNLLVSQLKSQSQAGINNKFRLLITTLIQTSLEEHRAIKYVERLGFSKLPPYISNFKDGVED
jgi:triacylglycerol lipase